MELGEFIMAAVAVAAAAAMREVPIMERIVLMAAPEELQVAVVVAACVYASTV
jgi:hypothetical protein